MLKLYFLRHGTTKFNEDEIVQGWNDSPLSKLGEYQAKCAGYGARDILFTKAYCGDAPRQINTAKLFLSENRHETPILEDIHFREKNYGKYEDGSYYDMLNPLFKMHNQEYGSYDDLYKYMDAIEIANEVSKRDETGRSENINEVWKRLSEGIDRIVAENINGNVLISTSSISIAAMMRNLFPDKPKRTLVDNCSLTIISYENGKYTLDDYNNIDYRLIGEQRYKKDF